jgi:hypothetical protein
MVSVVSGLGAVCLKSRHAPDVNVLTNAAFGRRLFGWYIAGGWAADL